MGQKWLFPGTKKRRDRVLHRVYSANILIQSHKGGENKEHKVRDLVLFHACHELFVLFSLVFKDGLDCLARGSVE